MNSLLHRTVAMGINCQTYERYVIAKSRNDHFFLKTYDLRNSKAIKLKNFPYFRYHVLKEILKKRKNKISQIPPFGPKSRSSKFRSNFAAGVTNREKSSFVLVYEIQTVCTRSKIQRRFDFARANSQSLYARSNTQGAYVVCSESSGGRPVCFQVLNGETWSCLMFVALSGPLMWTIIYFPSK